MRKSREEYLKEISPDAEKRVKRQLVLDEVAQQEEINVDSAEIDALLQAYAQAGQNLAGSDAQRQALASALRREKTITRLVELTTDPDPDEEAERAEDEEVSVANAEAAALSGEEDVVHVEAAEAGDIPEPALPTPGTEEPTAEEASNQTLTDTSIES
jgi:trigger factor